MIRKGSAVWHGSGAEGDGTVSVPSGVLADTPYSSKSRFVSKDGEETWTNPEELIAAAHAGCFSMALSYQISGAGFTAGQINTDAIVDIQKGDDTGWTIKSIKLKVEAEIPDIDDAKFQELAANAKSGCPVSKALSSVDISMEAKLK